MTTINSMYQTVGPVNITITVNLSDRREVSITYPLNSNGLAQKHYEELYRVMCQREAIEL